MRIFSFSKRFFNNFDEILPEDLDEMKAESCISDEPNYKDEWFQKFLDDVAKEGRKNYYEDDFLELLNFELLKGYQDVEKILDKFWKRKSLYVEMLDFSEDAFLESLKYFTYWKIPQDKLKEKAAALAAKARSLNGITVSFGDYPGFVIIYLNSRGSNEQQRHALKLEFLHFLEADEEKNRQAKLASTNFYAEEMNLLKKHGVSICADDIDLLTRSSAYHTLVNSLLYSLKDIRKRWYRKLDKISFIEKIDELFFKREDESNDNYLSRVNRLVCFERLKHNKGFLMLLIYNMIEKKLQNIKNHIFGEFNGK